jgi:hypothetical protein
MAKPMAAKIEMPTILLRLRWAAEAKRSLQPKGRPEKRRGGRGLTAVESLPWRRRRKPDRAGFCEPVCNGVALCVIFFRPVLTAICESFDCRVHEEVRRGFGE